MLVQTSSFFRPLTRLQTIFEAAMKDNKSAPLEESKLLFATNTLKSFYQGRVAGLSVLYDNDVVSTRCRFGITNAHSQAHYAYTPAAGLS